MCARGKCPAAVNTDTNALVKNAVPSLQNNSKYEVVVVLGNTCVMKCSLEWISHRNNATVSVDCR